MKTENILGSLISFGNRKLPKSTAIFNMQSAYECSSEKLNLCPIADKCYAKKAERMYPQVLPYRTRQSAFWRNCTAQEFSSMLFEINSKRKNKIQHLRISESGDFENQGDVEKVETIATLLRAQNIVTYTYTARRDLDYSGVKNLIINGSGFRKQGVTHTFTAVKDYTGPIKCAGDCTRCHLCYSNKVLDIQVKLH